MFVVAVVVLATLVSDFVAVAVEDEVEEVVVVEVDEVHGVVLIVEE